MKPNTCMGPSPSGLAGVASTHQWLLSLRIGSRALTLHCSHAEDSFPLQRTLRRPDNPKRAVVTPQKVIPELLSPWLSTEPPGPQPKCLPRRLWSHVDAGSIVEGGPGRRWVAEPEGRKREGVGDVGRSRKMWVLSTRKLASNQAILRRAWRGYHCFHFCCRALWLPCIARSFPELLLWSNIHMNRYKRKTKQTNKNNKKPYKTKNKTTFSWVCDPWWSLISFGRYILHPTVSNK